MPTAATVAAGHLHLIANVNIPKDTTTMTELTYEQKIEHLAELHKKVEEAIAVASAYASQNHLYYWVHAEGDHEPWESSEWSDSGC
jgi:hypothetical protein